MPKLSERFDEEEVTLVSSSKKSSLPPHEQDGYLELAKQLAELARTEAASHDALAKRITELEAALTTARKEMADVRVRNEKLEKQLKSATVAAEAAGVSLAAPPPTAHSATPAVSASATESTRSPAAAAKQQQPPPPPQQQQQAEDAEDDDENETFEEAEEQAAGEGGEDKGGAEPGAMTAEELKALEAEELKKKQESERKKAAEQEERDAKNAARDAEIAAKGKRAAGGVHKFDP
jgi:hypothetical protein